MSETFNPEMLVLARESMGLTQSGLAHEASMVQGSISKIEAGLLGLSDEQLDTLAHILETPRSFFFQTEPVYGYGSSCYYHRKRQSVPVSVLRQVMAQVNILRIQFTKLLRGAEIETENKFHRLDLADYENNPPQVARLIRGSWNLPPGPVQNLVEAIEDAGGVVFRLSFGTRKIDAISQWLPGLPPLFFVNSEIPGDRLRFTLAHELGHLIMHQVPTPNLEKEANQFASEFLMPAKEIGPHLNKLSIQKLAAMKPYWKVAMSALLRRAFDLGKISVSTYRKLNTQISAHGFKINEPVQIAIEEPSVLREVIEVHLRDHGYSGRDLAQLLRTTEHKFFQFYLPEVTPSPKLRIVG